MTRVLHLYRKFAPDYTGDGIYFLRLISHLRELRSEHQVLCVETPSAIAETVVEGVKVHYLSSMGGRRYSLHTWIWRHRRDFDILHIHSHVDWRLSAYALAQLLGKKLVFSCTLDDSPTEVLGRYRWPLSVWARLMLARVDRYVAISPLLYLKALRTMQSSRVELIPQAVDVPNPQEADKAPSFDFRGRLGLAADQQLFVTVGSICDRKNTRFLVERLAELGDRRVHLVVVGPVLEQGYADHLLADIRRLRLEDHVHLLGYQEDPSQWYSCAQGFVFASKSEGFGNVFLEAMSWRLPVLTLHLQGITDHLFDHGRSGLVVVNASDFTAEWRRLVDDKDLRKNIGQMGYDCVARDFSMKAIAGCYAKTYTALSSSKMQNSTTNALEDPPVRITGGRMLGHTTDCSMLSQHPYRDRFHRVSGADRVKDKAHMRPILAVVVDTESEFDWIGGVSTDRGNVTAVHALKPFIDELLDAGGSACLVLDYPVAHTPMSRELIVQMRDPRVELGIHLQPWTTPPLCTPADDYHSLTGNLSTTLQIAKLEYLRARVEALNEGPVAAFKAGRYGMGPATYEILLEQGLKIDLSPCPGYDYRYMGGPDWTNFEADACWYGRAGRLLVLPTTAGLQGPVAALVGRRHPGQWAEKALGRLRLARNTRLSPEGNSLADMKRLSSRLLKHGVVMQTMSLHSPSLMAGATPYARTEEEASALKQRALEFIRFFVQELGGEILTPSMIAQRVWPKAGEVRNESLSGSRSRESVRVDCRESGLAG